jgi:hypothetical protein
MLAVAVARRAKRRTSGGRTTSGGGTGDSASGRKGSAEWRADDTEVVVAGLGRRRSDAARSQREGDLESADLLLNAGANVNQVVDTADAAADGNRHCRWHRC